MFDIRSKSNQPIIMAGLTEVINLKEISKKNITTFVNDFYKTAFYVPEIALGGYDELLSFWSNYKDNKKLALNSNELDIKEIKNIKNVMSRSR